VTHDILRYINILTYLLTYKGQPVQSIESSRVVFVVGGSKNQGAEDRGAAWSGMWGGGVSLPQKISEYLLLKWRILVHISQTFFKVLLLTLSCKTDGN